MVQNYNTQTINSNTTLSTNVNSVFVNAASNNITITLPVITTNGIPYTFTRMDSSGNTVNIGPYTLPALSILKLVSYDNVWTRLPITNTLKSSQIMFATGLGTMLTGNGASATLTANNLVAPVTVSGVVMISQPGTISRLFVHMPAFVSGTIRFDVFRNGVSQFALTATTMAASNTTNSFSVVPGDVLYITYTNQTVIILSTNSLVPRTIAATISFQPIN